MAPNDNPPDRDSDDFSEEGKESEAKPPVFDESDMFPDSDEGEPDQEEKEEEKQVKDVDVQYLTYLCSLLSGRSRGRL